MPDLDENFVENLQVIIIEFATVLELDIFISYWLLSLNGLKVISKLLLKP
jgi:hypothetical protein